MNEWKKIKRENIYKLFLDNTPIIAHAKSIGVQYV